MLLIVMAALSAHLNTRFLKLVRRWRSLDTTAPLMLTWGGLRGGISGALALSVSDAVPHKNLLVAIASAGLLFSVIGQVLTLEKLVRRLYLAGKQGQPFGSRAPVFSAGFQFKEYILR